MQLDRYFGEGDLPDIKKARSPGNEVGTLGLKKKEESGFFHRIYFTALQRNSNINGVFSAKELLFIPP